MLYLECSLHDAPNQWCARMRNRNDQDNYLMHICMLPYGVHHFNTPSWTGRLQIHPKTLAWFSFCTCTTSMCGAANICIQKETRPKSDLHLLWCSHQPILHLSVLSPVYCLDLVFRSRKVHCHSHWHSRHSVDHSQPHLPSTSIPTRTLPCLLQGFLT